MRLALSTAILASTLYTGAAFVPSVGGRGAFQQRQQQQPLYSTTAERETEAANVSEPVNVERRPAGVLVNPLSSDEIKARREAQLAKLREKAATSPLLSKEVSICICQISEFRVGYTILYKTRHSLTILCV
jgi:hypothetical protein